VALALIGRFDLETRAVARMSEFGVDTPWQAFVQIRLRYYEELLADPDMLKNNQWPHNVALLHSARRNGCKTGLATMSYCTQVQRVLRILDLSGEFDFVASRDDVEHGKPDPEIYRLVSTELGIPPQECLVIEDSPSGVKAALAAGMWCIAVTTPFTRDQLHTADLLEERWIVDDPGTLMAVISKKLAERSQD
jgi:HAD superfamily hydrolase (TIGR01509 family)